MLHLAGLVIYFMSPLFCITVSAFRLLTWVHLMCWWQSSCTGTVGTTTKVEVKVEVGRTVWVIILPLTFWRVNIGMSKTCLIVGPLVFLLWSNIATLWVSDISNIILRYCQIFFVAALGCPRWSARNRHYHI